MFADKCNFAFHEEVRGQFYLGLTRYNGVDKMQHVLKQIDYEKT